MKGRSISRVCTSQLKKNARNSCHRYFPDQNPRLIKPWTKEFRLMGGRTVMVAFHAVSGKEWLGTPLRWRPLRLNLLKNLKIGSNPCRRGQTEDKGNCDSWASRCLCLIYQFLVDQKAILVDWYLKALFAHRKQGSLGKKRCLEGGEKDPESWWRWKLGQEGRNFLLFFTFLKKNILIG